MLLTKFLSYALFVDDTMKYFEAVPVRFVDPLKSLNSYGLGSVDGKEEIFKCWKLKQAKNDTNMETLY